MTRRMLTVLLFLALSSQIAYGAMQQTGADQTLEWEVVRQVNVPGKPVDLAHSLDGKYAFVLTEESVVAVYDKNGNMQGNIPVDKGVNAITVGPKGQFLYLSNSEDNTVYTLAIDYILKISDANSPTKGDVNAPVTIAIYSDFQ